MKILQRPRQAGKTTEAMLESARTGAVIVCKDSREVNRILNQALLLGLKIPVPIPLFKVEDYVAGRRVDLIVDDTEVALQYFLRRPVVAVTFTGTSGSIDWEIKK